MNVDPLRVCIVAEHASRHFGGEAILPFHYFRVLRNNGIDAHLIVHERTRQELVELFPQDLDHLHFVRDQGLQKLFFRASKVLPRRIAEATFGLANQLLTQFAQRRLVRGLVNANTVVHQPIPVSPRSPSLMYGLGCPVICGPLNGGMNYPDAFRSAESTLTRAFVAAGRSFSNFANWLLPGKRDAAFVLVANERTRHALPSGVCRVIELAENGVDLAQWPLGDPHAESKHNSGARFIFIGRLVDWKALDIVLDALALTPGIMLDVVGDGPMRTAWQQKADALGLADCVTFHGWMEQSASVPLLRAATALVLPSLFESGGAVVLEAMSMARPVIATAWGGPIDYIDSTCGILLPPTSRAALVSGFAEAMRLLRDDAALATQLGSAGRARVIANFDWDKKVELLTGIYRTALSERASTQVKP